MFILMFCKKKGFLLNPKFVFILCAFDFEVICGYFTLIWFLTSNGNGYWLHYLFNYLKNEHYLFRSCLLLFSYNMFVIKQVMLVSCDLYIC